MPGLARRREPRGPSTLPRTSISVDGVSLPLAAVEIRICPMSPSAARMFSSSRLFAGEAPLIAENEAVSSGDCNSDRTLITMSIAGPE